MAISIHIIGSTHLKGLYAEQLDYYKMLVRPYASLTVHLLKTTDGKFANRTDALAKEEKLHLSKWPENCYPVALSEEGGCMSSREFAEWLDKRLPGAQTIVFNIGSAYGFPEGLKKRCRSVISLSALTFPSHICFLLLAEQIYRAFTILKGHPYHK